MLSSSIGLFANLVLSIRTVILYETCFDYIAMQFFVLMQCHVAFYPFQFLDTHQKKAKGFV